MFGKFGKKESKHYYFGVSYRYIKINSSPFILLKINE